MSFTGIKFEVENIDMIKKFVIGTDNKYKEKYRIIYTKNKYYLANLHFNSLIQLDQNDFLYYSDEIDEESIKVCSGEYFDKKMIEISNPVINIKGK
jgi:hypothetical protein